MRFMYYFISFCTGKYKFRIYDFFVDKTSKELLFIITPIIRFEPLLITLPELMKKEEIISTLDPDSLKIYEELLSHIKSQTVT